VWAGTNLGVGMIVKLTVVLVVAAVGCIMSFRA
jgi:hypothetical protein